MALDITIKEFPARHLTGMVIRTDMQTARSECPALWEMFAQRIASFPSSENISEAYGVSVKVSEDGTFDYWAAVETLADVAVPENMKTIELPAGLYASTFAPNLEGFEAVYQEMYTEWSQQQSEYSVNMQAPCVEVYRQHWQPSDPLEILVHVLKKI